MCGRYGRRADKQRIAEWFHTHNTDVFNDEYYEINSTRLVPSYNISPESIQPVVRFDRDTGERILALMKWGLVPYWSKTPKASFSSINARSDKLESSGAWREPWKHRRCLIPAEFFFEWEPLTKEEEKKKLSKPWVVSLTDDVSSSRKRMPLPVVGRNLGGTHSVWSSEIRGRPRRSTGSSCTARTSRKS